MNAELPYLGTQGFVNRDASIGRARTEAASGVAGERQRQVLEFLAPLSRSQGATWIEVGEALRLHHGQVSACLSVLHSAGKVFQLREKRGRSHPYVHADWRALFIASERYDEPVKTNARILKEAMDEAEAYLEVALEADEGQARHLVNLALRVLRGDA